MLGHEDVDGLNPRSPSILVRVPLCCGHLGEGRLHLVSVIEELPVEVTRVPIDENAAQVEDHGGRRIAGIGQTLSLERERGGLESRWACKRLVGSNHTPPLTRRFRGREIERVAWNPLALHGACALRVR
jgi:hypothetical protein